MELKNLTKEEREELYSLDFTIAEFILPRLRNFKEVNNGYPGEMSGIEEWETAIDKMILGFEVSRNCFLEKEEIEKRDEGLLLFAKWFDYLWL